MKNDATGSKCAFEMTGRKKVGTFPLFFVILRKCHIIDPI